MSKPTHELKSLYKKAKKVEVGQTAKCPSCETLFLKTSYQQVFCKTKAGTICKDFYWNNVTLIKKNNTTRISPANAAFKEKKERRESINEGPEGWDGHKDTF